MRISINVWNKYIEKLSKLNVDAAGSMKSFLAENGALINLDDKAYRMKMIDYAFGLVTKYGEGSAALSAEMYDLIAEFAGKVLPPAELAETPTYDEVAKMVNGILKQSSNIDMLANGVSRLVKQTGQDTTLHNAIRDGAQWAWIPNGDTCSFCLALAARGWQPASRKALRNGHAEHIHGNCDCAYCVRFDNDSSLDGYDPSVYEDIYYSTDANSAKGRINELRRINYAKNKDKINAQKREAYKKRMELERGVDEK